MQPLVEQLSPTPIAGLAQQDPDLALALRGACDYMRGMGVPLTFASDRDYGSRLCDCDFWSPYVAAVLARHDLVDSRVALVAGANPTYPTFLYGDVVIKLFSFVGMWRRGCWPKAGCSMARAPLGLT